MEIDKQLVALIGLIIMGVYCGYLGQITLLAAALGILGGILLPSGVGFVATPK